MNSYKQIITHKQTQELAIKPKMLQSLEMLSMPLLELELHLKNELVENPMLELLDDDNDEDNDSNESEGSTEQNSKDNESESENDHELETDDPELKKTLEEAKELSDILESWNEYHQEERTGSSKKEEEFDFEILPENSDRNRDKFTRQLSKYKLTENEYEFAIDMIELCNEYGFLSEDFDLYQFAQKYEIGEERADEIHSIILHLSPNGITARNINECLISQLNENQIQDDILVSIITKYFEDLIHRRYQAIASSCKISLDQVNIYRNEISKLDPKPGLRIISNTIQYIMPDVIIKKVDEDYEIIINDTYAPNIKLKRDYKKILSTIKNSQEIEYVRNKINSAKFLIKSIYMRNKTLEKVTRCIIDHQKPLFYGNSGILEPLTYSVLAEELGFNESTISRVVKTKYADTPFGVMCLKDFF
ncbi:MAG: RNA polymerase sigma-54 factor, partial [Candidatus Cloacimonetes bacterium]|nr:RNA polymerase sigma-54 factor [Candidatus Cloacimonadota bacterium]